MYKAQQTELFIRFQYITNFNIESFCGFVKYRIGYMNTYILHSYINTYKYSVYYKG